MKTFDEAAYKAAAEIAELIVMKQKDYGHGNILAFGEYGVLVRSSDKLERLKNLAKKGGIVLDINLEYTCDECGETRTFSFGGGKADVALNEPIKDTWADLAGYSIIALMLRNGTFTLPLKEDKGGD